MDKLGMTAMPARVYLGRQIIIDREQRIIGYELLYRHGAHADRAEIVDHMAAGVEVLSTLLTHMGMEWLLGDHPAFLNMSAAMLESELIDLLPADRIVLEIAAPSPTPELEAHCQRLRQRGFRISLDDPPPAVYQSALLRHADYVKLDIQALGPAGILSARKALAGCPAKFIAKKVETPSEFRACRELGLDGYQGYHFAHPETLSVRAISPAQVRVMELLNLIRVNADLAEIEAALKCDVALSVRLLRYINSVGVGRARQIHSIQHALILLGYRQLYRWLSLLLLARDNRPAPPALARTALIRGRLTELLGSERLQGHEQDNLFLTGLFSLIDAILEVPMDKALASLKLPDSISEALLRHSGIYGAFLELAEACETGDWSRIDTLAHQLGLTPEQVNDAHLRALAWAEEIPL